MSSDARAVLPLRTDCQLSWATLRIGEIKIDSVDEQYLFETEVYLGALDVMVHAEERGGTDGRFVFIVLEPAVRQFADFTARLFGAPPEGIGAAGSAAYSLAATR